MPLRSLYFVYYVLCRRGQMVWPKSRRPTFYAAWVLVFVIGWITMDLIQFIDYFIDWRSPLAKQWLAHGLSSNALNADASSFMIVAIIVTLIVYHLVFRWKYYPWLLTMFGAYTPNGNVGRFINMALIFSFVPLLFIGWVTIYALHHNPVIPTLIVWAIVMANEIAFRLWWRWWSRKHAASG